MIGKCEFKPEDEIIPISNVEQRKIDGNHLTGQLSGFGRFLDQFQIGATVKTSIGEFVVERIEGHDVYLRSKEPAVREISGTIIV